MAVMSDRVPGPAEDHDDDLYATLGVPGDATADDITRAYRRLAGEHHPDTGEPQAKGAAFSDLADAYDVLRDAGRRQSYDATRRTRGDAARAAAGVRIPVRHVSGEGGGPAHPAHPAGHPAAPAVELPLSFEQAALGTTATVQFPAQLACATCEGSGSTGVPCEECAGRGATSRLSAGIAINYACVHCDGAGTLARPCGACSGSGLQESVHEATVRVPAGAGDGTQLRFRDPGSGREMVAVVRTAPHRYFARSGRDLTLRLPLTLAEAALGCVVTVPTLTGAVAMRVPPGTPSGRTFRVRGRGIAGGSQPGDLLVTVDVVVPTSLNDRQRAALEAFAEATESPRGDFER